MKILLMAVVLAGLLFSLSASAQESCNDPKTITSCNSLDIQPLSYFKNIEIPKFDSMGGIRNLISVKLTSKTCGWVVTEVDSEDVSPRTYKIVAQGYSIATLPDGDEILSQFGTPDAGVEHLLAADDEPGMWNADWAGPDYVKFEVGTQANPICSVIDDSSTRLYYEGAMDPFIGSGKVLIPVEATGNADSPGSVSREVRGYGEVGVEICVEYTYCLAPNFCINGSKVNDCTGDGLAGWTINLKDATGAVIKTTKTNADGEYSFCDLKPGSYTVCEEMQAGWKNVGDTCIPVALDADKEGVDFRNTPPFCISGHKFNNATDAGLVGWTINLKDATGTQIATTTTGADGSYKFCGVFSGSYTVCEVMKAGWKSVGDICKPVTLDCGDETDVDFRNDQVKTGCDTGCPWHIVSELYKASCGVPLVVSPERGILANDRVGAEVINPGLITIDPKYGTLSVDGDGSFTYTPAQKIASGTYVTFKYGATDGICAATGQGTAKIQVYCKR